jgi:hypothetical protein
MVLRILANNGVLLRKAVALAEEAIVPVVRDAFDMLCGVETPTGKKDLLIAVYNRGEEGYETYDFRWFLGGELVEQGSNGETIASWMARDTICDVILIQPSQVAYSLLSDMDEVLTGRGTEGLREEMEFALALVRRPKRKSTGTRRTAANKRRKGTKSPRNAPPQ